MIYMYSNTLTVFKLLMIITYYYDDDDDECMRNTYKYTIIAIILDV